MPGHLTRLIRMTPFVRHRQRIFSAETETKPACHRCTSHCGAAMAERPATAPHPAFAHYLETRRRHATPILGGLRLSICGVHDPLCFGHASVADVDLGAGNQLGNLRRAPLAE